MKSSIYDTIAKFMITEPKQRTIQQNKAIHVFFENLAQRLNESGNDMRATLKPGIEIPWTSYTVKNFLWRPIQQLQCGKKSTVELTTKEVNQVYETLVRHLGEKLGIEVGEFPSIESQIDYEKPQSAR